MDESNAVEAFEHLGLTSYEAKVFIALHRIGTGTARDISRTTDVPRSQVYSAAESLADGGLIDIQRSSPMQYRPVSPETARSTLRDRMITEQERAFEYVETVRQEGTQEQREEIWTIQGREGIADRVAELANEAGDRVVFGTADPGRITPDIGDALAACVERGVDVTVISESEAVRDRFRDVEEVGLVAPPAMVESDPRTGRLLLGDDDMVLLSVLDPGLGADPETEIAVWSVHSSFAAVLIRLTEIGLGVA
jgi:sugar-specific transcriptional regulator TrmB